MEQHRVAVPSATRMRAKGEVEPTLPNAFACNSLRLLLRSTSHSFPIPDLASMILYRSLSSLSLITTIALKNRIMSTALNGQLPSLREPAWKCRRTDYTEHQREYNAFKLVREHTERSNTSTKSLCYDIACADRVWYERRRREVEIAAAFELQRNSVSFLPVVMTIIFLTSCCSKLCSCAGCSPHVLARFALVFKLENQISRPSTKLIIPHATSIHDCALSQP